MIVTPRIALRIVAVVVVGVILQLAFFSHIHIVGTEPDIVPTFVVAFGLLGGSVLGAGVGFSAGLLVDTLLLQTMGISSLVLCAVGYLSGRIREIYDIQANTLIPPLVCGGMTLLAVLGFGLMQLMLGVDTQLSALVIRDLLVKSILNVFFGGLVYLIVRRLVEPALIDDRARPGRRRRERRAGLGTA